MAAYKALDGPLAAVPVENTGGEGTADSHWRTSVFGNELMIGFDQPLPNPLSTITIGSLIDLGYDAGLAAADSYAIPSAAPATQGARSDRWEWVIRPKFTSGPNGVVQRR